MIYSHSLPHSLAHDYLECDKFSAQVHGNYDILVLSGIVGSIKHNGCRWLPWGYQANECCHNKGTEARCRHL